MSERLPISKVLSRSSHRVWPMAWVWITIVTAVLGSIAVVAIQARQRRIMTSFLVEQSLLRQARIDLAKGYLHVSLAGSPEFPFDRAQGLALLDQAASSLERAARLHRQYSTGSSGTGQDEASSSLLANFAREVAQFRRLLVDGSDGGERDPAREAQLRIAFFALERRAEAIDTRTQQDLDGMLHRYDDLQALVMWGSAVLLVIICAAVYVGGRSRKRAEEALHRALADLRHSEEELRETDRRKNEFLGVLSHELRNPLAPIRNSVYVLERTITGTEQSRKALTVIGRQVGHLARLVDDLLEVTRVTQGRLQLQRARLDLGEVVRRTLEDYRPECEAKGIQLAELAIEQGLHLQGDATRIAQVVGNLLGNAIKFTPAGGRIEVSLRREGAVAVMRVRDDGVGIAPELLGQLFKPFSQAPQTLARTQGGLGLGLALVKRLIELHGGSVEASSPGLGKGSEFTIRLPLEAAAALDE